MTGDLTIENPTEGSMGEISGLLLAWYEGFGYGTLNVNNPGTN